MIQAIIARMAGNSFLLKGWAVTLVAGLTAVAKTGQHVHVAWIGCGVAAVFAVLDAMYVALEREYRALYRRVVDGKASAWSLTPSSVSLSGLLGTLISWSVAPIYVAAAIGAAIVATGA